MTALHQIATFSRSEHDHRCRKPTGSFRAAERTFRKRPVAVIASSALIRHFDTMGWIARPGSAEDKLNRWMTSKNQLRMALWSSACVCAFATWSVIESTKSGREGLAAIPALFGVGAIIASVYLGRAAQPPNKAWRLSKFLTLPVFIYIVFLSGIGGTVMHALR
jgi:hypothetical protein